MHRILIAGSVEQKYIAPRMKQQSLFESETKRRYKRTEHGGMSTKGQRKLERPFGRRKWIHLVLKSDKAYGKLSLLSAQNQVFVRSLLYEKAKRFGVDLADF